MKRLIIAAALLASVVVTAAVVNKTVTGLGSSVRAHTVCFRRNETGTVIGAEAYGAAFQSDGGVAESLKADWFLGAAARTTANSFMDNQAATQLRTDNGYEQ